MSIGDQYISGEYAAKNPAFHVEDSPWKAQQIHRMLRSLKLEPKTIAEVGCGAGEILVQLAGLYPQTTFSGYELSPDAFALCQQRASDRVSFYQSDMFESTNSRFDLVLCIDVIEHVEDYFAFLRALRQKGSSFIFHVPIDMNVQMVLRAAPILKVRDRVGHLHYFSKETALAALADCGYTIQSWFYTPNGVDRPTSIKARLLKLPRRTLFFLNSDLTVRILGGYELLVFATS